MAAQPRRKRVLSDKPVQDSFGDWYRIGDRTGSPPDFGGRNYDNTYEYLLLVITDNIAHFPANCNIKTAGTAADKEKI